MLIPNDSQIITSKARLLYYQIIQGVYRPHVLKIETCLIVKTG